MKLIHVVGARPNFVKVAPVHRAIAKRTAFEQTIVHTGQHYDRNMSAVFFEQLGLAEPDRNLGVGSDSHARQTAAVMVAFEQVVQETEPDLVLVYGDINSTVAAALVCAKLGVPVAHVEAGLRSRDRSMPEELNRLVTDQLADLLLTPSPDADENLLAEGIPAERIRRVGNVMIDTLVRLLPRALKGEVLQRLHLEGSEYAVLTMHRPGNVDDETTLARLLEALAEIGRDVPVVFPVHPRTRQRLVDLGVSVDDNAIRMIEPLGYLEFLALQSQARLVLTDSGGIQEETSYLGVPCLTIRPNTERPITVEMGTNRLVGRDPQRVLDAARDVLSGAACWDHRPVGGIPLWDGRAGERIAELLLAMYA